MDLLYLIYIDEINKRDYVVYKQSIVIIGDTLLGQNPKQQ